MKTDEIRDSFIGFFQGKAHTLVPSDSLVPQNDPTLLFTGAGMNQFKENFLGIKKDLRRATTSQKCLRTGDLDHVGKTAFHHSFFEMLGNFSFGDYFKEEAITWAWEYLTGVLKIQKERLRVSVHQSDEEAVTIWRSKIGVREEWIHKMGDKSNFWPANAPAEGPNGPCGPCSEIYYDQEPGAGAEDLDSFRFAEIWNLVFTQYDRRDGGKLVALSQKNIDTGMGLERLACVLQNKKTNYEIDIFQPINERIAQLLKITPAEKTKAGLYTIADHVRAVVFSVADGVIPSNEGRGYVIRKLIRRAVWHARQIAAQKNRGAFLYELVPTVACVMAKAYPEIAEASESIALTLRGEEEKFLDTLETGLKILDEHLEELRKKGVHTLPGEVVFELYDTYGFPDELTKTIAEGRGISIDPSGFERAMDTQRKRAKDASPLASEIFVTTDFEKNIAGLPATVFTGYRSLREKARVLFANVQDGKGVAILDQTPFYGESGGQVGDLGILENGSFRARVLDTQKKDNRFLHFIEVENGRLKAGDEVTASVDFVRRGAVMRNHTATHLLHAALRKTLGPQVRQLGSLVSAEKLRFDYSYNRPLSDEEIAKIEELVNGQILTDLAVSKEEKTIQEAKGEGALAFFGEKYGSHVRVLTISDFSKELCGGTHCDRTGEIGVFLILGDSSVASGTRRIEALTGTGALEYIQNLRSQMMRLAQNLRTSPADVPDRVLKLQESVKNLEKEKKQNVVAKADPKKILSSAAAAGSCQFAAYCEKEMDIREVRLLSDQIRSMSSQTIYFLATENQDKIQFLVGLSPDLAKAGWDARPLAKEIALLLEASSGGSAHLVQGGAPNRGQLQAQWENVAGKAIAYLKEKFV